MIIEEYMLREDIIERLTDRLLRYLELPPKGRNGKLKYVIEIHGRGRSIHKDFRFEIDTHLLGWTILDNGFPMKPRDLSHFKMLVEKHDWKFTPEKKAIGIRAETKARQPKGWLDIGGKLKKIGDTVEIPPGGVGATRWGPGYFYLWDKGTITIGTLKPYFFEYFLDGEKFKKTRIVIRGVKVPRIDPETKKPIKGQYEIMWRAMVPREQEPYAVSKRARRKGWVPPRGFIPIPNWWIKENPRKYEEWKKWIEGRLEEKLASTRFTLHRIQWKGPKVIRDIPNRTWYLRLDDKGEGSIRSFYFEENPYYLSGLPATDEGRIPRTWLDKEGRLRPGDRYCPTKELPCQVIIEDEGRVDLEFKEEDGREIILLDFKGKLLKGKARLEQEEKESDFYVWFKERKEKLAGLVFVYDHHTLYPEGKEPVSHFDIRMRIGQRDHLLEFNLYDDLLGKKEEEEVLARKKIGLDLSWLEDDITKGYQYVGKLRTKVERLDKGTGRLIEEEDNFLSFFLDGKKLKGWYIARKEDSYWVVMKSRLPGVLTSEGSPREGKPYSPPKLEDHTAYFYYRLYDLRRFTRCEPSEYYLDLKEKGVTIGTCLYPVPGTFHHVRVAYVRFDKEYWDTERALDWLKKKRLEEYEWEMKRGKLPPKVFRKP